MLTAELLRELLDYDRETGIFTWRIDRQGGARAGRVAGSFGGHKYQRIHVAGELHYAHRLAWLYVTGEWPSDQIDHIDRDKANNSFANLRPATCSQNGANSGPRKKNTSGYKGVSLHKRTNKWVAYIRAPGRQTSTNLGYFDTPEAANEAYCAAAEKHYGEFAKPKPATGF